MKRIESVLNKIIELGLYPKIFVIDGLSSSPEVVIEGEKYLHFSSANYLGMTTKREIIDAIHNGFIRYGIHPTGSRIISGTQDIHRLLEVEIARYKNTASSMIFTSGVMANIGSIPAIADIPVISANEAVAKFLGRKKTVIFSDEDNHASIIDGIRLSRCKVEKYHHRDANDLENRLKKHKRNRKLIITDGVFSMLGTIAPLKDIVTLSKKYDALLYVDDAHGTGILGRNGKGTAEFFSIPSSDITVNMGTFSKAFGVLGGFVACSEELKQYLEVAARTYVFSGGFLGGLAAGIIKSIELVEHADQERKRLWVNTNMLNIGLQQAGFNTLGSQTPIISIFIGEEALAISFYQKLFEKGIFAPCYRWPAVKRGQSIIRFNVTALHEEQHISRLLQEVIRVGKELKVTS